MKKYNIFTVGALLLCSIFFVQNIKAQTHIDSEYIKKAEKLHKRYLTIDTHNDAAMRINNPFGRYPAGSKGQVDFDLMKQGGLDAAVFAIYIKQGLRDEQSSQKAVQFVTEQIEKLKEFTSNHKEAALAKSKKELYRNKRKGLSTVVLGIENGYAIGKEINNVSKFALMGVRVMTICHSYNNDICDSSTDTLVEFTGLSTFGEQVIRKMNEAGIIVDVSHASKETVLDVLKISEYPIIASHSGAYSVNSSPRNLTDEEIIAIAKNGGVVQVVSLRSYLSTKPKEQVTVKDMADHIDYIKNLVGIKYVGIGTDFDGGGGVAGMEDASKMKSLTVELLKRGYSNKDLKLFWGGNFLRVLSEQKKSKYLTKSFAH